jgi:imidazolonepropionase-like amidohydrolase
VLPSATVLKQATVNGAKILNRSSVLGRIAVDYYADLLVLKENPLEDINIFSMNSWEENILGVIKDGRVVRSRIKGLNPDVAV